LALSVPLSRFTSRVGGGSAFYVRPLCMRQIFPEFIRMRRRWFLIVLAVVSVACLFFAAVRFHSAVEIVGFAVDFDCEYSICLADCSQAGSCEWPVRESHSKT
jgi:hypothetical protein